MFLWTVNQPLYGILPIQDMDDLIPADLLVIRVTGQAVESPGDPTGCGVMALKHEGIHLCSDVLVRQPLVLLILGE